MKIAIVTVLSLCIHVSLKAPSAPAGISSVKYRIKIKSEDGKVRSIPIFRSRHVTGERITLTLGSLEKDTVYSIRIRMGVSYSVCHWFTFEFGNNSDPVSFKTNDTRKIHSF